MRVYLPVTLPELAAAHASGAFPDGTPAHAVTPTMREWYVEGDLEELEYAALTEAAEASLRRIAALDGVVRRRVVVAADVPDEAVRPAPDEIFRSAVRLSGPVPLDAVASVHVDEPEAGDDDAQFLLDEAEATELLWYDVSEIPDLA
jgi:hypothetical protein